MRKTIFFILISFLSSGSFAQIIPVQNSKEELHSQKVKSLSTFSISSDGGAERLIFQKKFDLDGRLTRKYQLSLWEAISNSHTTSYTYNDSGLLVEEIIVQEYLSLFERDKDYLKIFGNNPLNQKIKYHYDHNLLTKKEIFPFEGEDVDPGVLPNQTIDYHYDNEVLVIEESSSKDEKFFNQNYKMEYEYDSSGNVIRKSMTYGVEHEFKRKFIFKYDSLGRLIEDQVQDPSIPHNSRRLKYEYNDQGQLIHKYIFDDIEKVFELETSYQYDDKGNATSGNREVIFEYYEDGLIKSESWKDTVSDEAFIFHTRYEYY